MALIQCTECGNAVSDKAKLCPKCGAPIVFHRVEKKRTIVPITLTVFLVLIVCCLVLLLLKPFSIRNIRMAQDNIYIEPGQEFPIGYYVEPSYLKKQKLEWSVSDTGVAEIHDGVVKGLKEGSTELTVKSKNGKEETCRIVVSSILGEWEWDSVYIEGQRITDAALIGYFLVDQDTCSFTSTSGKTYTGKWKYEENRKGIDIYSFDADGYLDFLITIKDDSLTVSTDMSTDIVNFFSRKR